jgi:KDO2-lipid IV(A) lauroyltransferase
MAVIVKRDLPFLGFAGAAIGLRAVPRSDRYRWCHAAAKRVGPMWHRIDRSTTALVRKNMRKILGSRLSEDEINAAVREHFQNVSLGMLVNDALSGLTLDDMLRFLMPEGVEHLDEALERGRGVIFLGVHFGLHAYTPLKMLGLMGYEITAVLGAEIQEDDSWIYRNVAYPIRARSRAGMDVIHLTGAPQRHIMDALQQNHVVLIMGDALGKHLLEMPAPQVMPAPLLGHALLLPTGPFRLARWLRSPLIPFFAVPQNDGFAFVIDPPLELSPVSSAYGLRTDLAAFTARFEPYISRYPALWANWRTGRLVDLMQPTEDEVFEMETVRVG